MTHPGRIVAGALLTVALAERARAGDDELARDWWEWLDMLVELRRDTWPS